ncbi:MAG: ECF-type sigma factor [Rhodanobacteraceae bacterium]
MNNMNAPAEITQLLQAAQGGDNAAREALLPHIYRELHALAHRQLSGGRRGGHTLCTTALVHEAFLRLADQQAVSFADRAHFLGYCSRVMRSIVVDQARRQASNKRGGQLTRIEWREGHVDHSARPEQVLALDQALDRLKAIDPRMAKVTEMQVFGGLKSAECGVVLGISERTVKRDWRKARAMLAALLAGESDT